jgi:acyl-CoA thioesterase-1
MNWLVYHAASGQSFFSGIALVVIAALATRRATPIARRVTVLAFLIGAIAIAISSTPIPYWYYGLAIVVTLLWILSRFVTSWRRWSAFAVIAAWTVAGAIEIPHHVMPNLHPAESRAITVIGDSVTAGMGGDDHAETWPNILARENNLEVQDISHVGETAASALKRVKANPIASSVVIVEIGGNDLLGTTSASQFDRDLDALLTQVTAPNRQVIMFELPLPPFTHEYGRIQRTLARQHGVLLIPKRVFLTILAGDGSTLDTIHLSPAGHERMAACVWQIVRSAFPHASDL